MTLRCIKTAGSGTTEDPFVPCTGTWELTEEELIERIAAGHSGSKYLRVGLTLSIRRPPRFIVRDIIDLNDYECWFGVVLTPELLGKLKEKSKSGK